MSVENNDWLDQRLAARDSYVSDDGFTAQVMDHLPKKRLATADQIRWRVLGVSVVIALCLFALQIVPLFQDLNPLLTHYTSPGFLEHFVAQCKSPMVLLPIAGSMVVLTFAAIPFLRRWV